MTDLELVFESICDELGCAFDNEAALEAIAELKTGSIVSFDTDKIIGGLRYDAGTYRIKRIGPPADDPKF